MKPDFFTKSWTILAFSVGLIVLMTSCKSKNQDKMTESTNDKIETGVYLKKTFNAKEGKLNYRILYPTGFDKTKKYPVLLFLHGSGERGDDNEAQLVHGAEMIKKGMDVHQSIAIFPQCPKDSYWVSLVESEESGDGNRNFEISADGPPTYAMANVIEFMNAFTSKEYVDNSRLYVAGLSMGGMGTYDLCWRMPDMFAAANIICGAGVAEKAALMSHLPIRIFHGDEDQVVSVDESHEMIEALSAAGGSPEIFIYHEVNHNSWDNAFAEPDFLSWFYKFQKG